jgi:hypothetical protein
MVGLLQEIHPVGLTEPKFIANSTISMNGVNGKNDTKATNNFQSGTATLPKNKSNKGWRAGLDEDDYAVLGLRNFIFDICNHNGGGHGGSAIGMAAIGVALYKYIMRYNPSDPSWFDRDRFVLSNGMGDHHSRQTPSWSNRVLQVTVLCFYTL